MIQADWGNRNSGEKAAFLGTCKRKGEKSLTGTKKELWGLSCGGSLPTHGPWGPSLLWDLFNKPAVVQMAQPGLRSLVAFWSSAHLCLACLSP